MKPYQASGTSARLRLMEHEAEPKLARRAQLMDSLHSFKFVINCIGVCAMLLTPAIGAMTRSAVAAFACAAAFLAVLTVLEILERRVKRKLRELH